MSAFRVILAGAMAVGLAATMTARVSAAGSAIAPASACPRLVHREARTPGIVLRDFGRQVRALFDSPHGAYRGYEVQAVASLSATAPPALDLARYVRLARAACGADAARRSWVVVAWFPNSRAATVGQEVYWLAPTRDGWQAWWVWNPMPGWDKTGAFPGR
jgi:hypothetical protein